MLCFSLICAVRRGIKTCFWEDTKLLNSLSELNKAKVCRQTTCLIKRRET